VTGRRRSSSALRPGGSTRRWRLIRAAILRRDRHRCQFPGRAPIDPGSWADLTALPELPVGVCGEYADHVDHLITRYAGGGDTPLNLRAACADHNLTRGKSDTGHNEDTARRAPGPSTRWEW
jgi:5-methylcytosine-specific restriction endonuclease McrA